PPTASVGRRWRPRIRGRNRIRRRIPRGTSLILPATVATMPAEPSRDAQLQRKGTVMSKSVYVLGVFLLAVLVRAEAQQTKVAPQPGNTAALEKLKKLAGEWVAADKDGKPTAQVVT